MNSLYSYQLLAQQMIEQDREKDRMLAAMESMWRGEWHLPEEISALRWIHKVISTDPHDALRAGMRVLSSVAPRIKVMPAGGEEEEQAAADKLEHALGWLFHQANRRRQATVLRDVVLSALLYDEVVAQVVYLPHQIEALKAAGGDTRRMDIARRGGPFAVLVRNPRQVHVRYSDWMPEAVLHKRVLPVEELIQFWGKQAEAVRQAVQAAPDGSMRYATLYDYMDLECRVVWAYLHEDGGLVLPGAALDGETHAVEIMRAEHKLGFLPWVAKVGGTTLPENAAHRRVPMLYSVYQAGQWETLNILETLLTSEVIAYAAAPRLKVEGPTDNVEVDYGEPGRMAYVPPGHNLSLLTPPGLDTSLEQIANRMSERIGKSTVPRVLQTADFPSGTAFATLNLATQSGLKSLTPYKELAETALAEVFSQMLGWIEYLGKPVLAYAPGGEQLLVDPREFTARDLYLDVELTADVPLDKVSRINAAATAVRELSYSRGRALEYIGESDPAAIIDESRQEDLQALVHRLKIQQLTALAEARTRQLLADAGLQVDDQSLDFDPEQPSLSMAHAEGDPSDPEVDLTI